SDWDFRIESKKGNVRTTAATPSIVYLNPAISNYYIQLERISKGMAQLSVFTDSSYSTHVAGSPVTFVIDSTITGLNTIQHGTSTPGWYYRYNNATIDNDTICDDGNFTPTCSANFTYTIGTGGQVSFTNNGASSYNTWAFGDGNTSNTLNPTYTYSVNGVYNVQENVTDSSGNIICSNVQSVTVGGIACNTIAPVVSYTLVPDSLPHYWDIYVNYPLQDVNAVWNWGDGTSSVGLYASHSYSAPGNYNICVTAYNACNDSVTYCQTDSIYRMAYNTSSVMSFVSVKSVNATTGINKIQEVELALYPNPSNGYFTIQAGAQPQTLQVLDLNGNLVLTQTISGTTVVDASSLTNGVYNLSIISNGKPQNKKLVIVK
ncbi:MAG TPA: PKD domain-containing protein, partial [Bacteroidia bacterium]|nr:PKD domain-containing protein [Bacteroidia bacterium]